MSLTVFCSIVVQENVHVSILSVRTALSWVGAILKKSPLQYNCTYLLQILSTEKNSLGQYHRL